MPQLSEVKYLYFESKWLLLYWISKRLHVPQLSEVKYLDFESKSLLLYWISKRLHVPQLSEVKDLDINIAVKNEMNDKLKNRIQARESCGSK